MKLSEIVEASSNLSIQQQLEEIRDGSDKYQKQIKAWILKDESAYDKDESFGKAFTIHVPKVLPADIKKRYPDVVFFIHQILRHVASAVTYNKWEEVKKYLSYSPNLERSTYYRLWHIPEDASWIEDLESGKNVSVDGKKYLSYTKHSDPENHLSTEQIKRTNSKGDFMVTKHEFVPIFDVDDFVKTMKDAIKTVFKIDFNVQYDNEAEVIGPAISKITPDMFEYRINFGVKSRLGDKPVVVKLQNKRGKDVTFKLMPDVINKLKTDLQQDGKLDMSLFDHSLIIADSLTNYMVRYVKDNIQKHDELSKILNTDIYVGYWN